MAGSVWQFLGVLPAFIPLIGAVAIFIFQLWMCIDAVRRGEIVWAVLMWFFPFFYALIYYFVIYRSATQGFELPGAAKRQRIKELQAQIHHLDNADHHFRLGDVYFRQGKFQKSEACYRAARERDPSDIDTRAHLGQCLLRLKRPQEARPLLEVVCQENPRHDFGYSMMALAESLTALGEQDAALATWLKVTANHSYPRAKVQLAELYLGRREASAALTELKDALADDAHAPAFQRRRDRVWVRKARALMRKATRESAAKA